MIKKEDLGHLKVVFFPTKVKLRKKIVSNKY